MSLHNQIMNIPGEVDCYPAARNNDEWKDGYAYGHKDARHAAAELALGLEAVNAELLEALLKLCGTPDDPRNGWQGPGGTHEVFACEYCNAKHGDCTQVPHSPTCPIPFARAAISRATGEQINQERKQGEQE